MILAAAEAAEKTDATPPPELVLQWRMARYGTLPRAGGLEDQPAGLIDRAETCANVYNAMIHARDLKAKDFQNKHASEYRTWQYVLRLRRELADANGGE